MFLQDEGDSNNSATNSSSKVAKELTELSSATGVLDFSIRNFQKTLATNLPLGPKGLANITNATSKLEELTFKLTTETLGQTRLVGEGIRDTMAQAAYESAQYGITLSDQISVFKEINTIMQRNTLLTSEQQTNMALLARNAGVAAGDIATMVEAFDTIGVGTTDAMNNISNMQKEARSYGINVGQFMKNIGSKKGVKLI